MSSLVLTVVGDDRAGLVAALADVVTAHGGNWEHSQLAELAGTFAGIVVVAVPDGRVAEFTAALTELDGLLKVTAHPGAAAEVPTHWQGLTLSVLGNDHPGIIRDISAALSRHQLSIESLTSQTLDAPMSGGRLFEAQVVARVPEGADLGEIRADLERLASEILVDLALTDD
ncbi:MAG: ACT domain-containing protein [Propionicimonas sp.]